MSDFVNPASLTYVFMDIGKYDPSERNYAKKTWTRLASEHGAEKTINPETTIKHEINYDLPFQGVRISQKSDLTGLIAAFRDADTAAAFAFSAYKEIDPLHKDAVMVSNNNVGFIPYTGPGYH